MAIGSKTYIKKILYIRVGLLFSFVAIILLCLSVYDRWVIEREMASRSAAAVAEYEALERRQQGLKKDVEYLSKESSIEGEIRKHFDVVKAGEQVVVIMDEPTSTNPILPLSVLEPAEKAHYWYQFWR